MTLAATVIIAPFTSPGAEARATPDGFADLISQVGAGVVQVTVRNHGPVNKEGGTEIPEQFRDGPFRDFFERFFQEGVPGGPPPPQAEKGALGSGFIISADGYVVTNNHVVGDAQTIEVTLKDGTRLPARMVGSDDKTDLAVVKVDAPHPLPTVAWGNSDASRIGDWVVAVGNPFGLSGTATEGIVSSRGRDLGAGPYDDFIQIDAPINTGNSGGPLFNTEGQVIGVNTAIFSPNGGNIGIGFAIPSNVAQKVVAELQDHGTVHRGWLGVSIQAVTPEVAESLNLAKPEGALVASVLPNSPAEKSGIRLGDIVMQLDGKAVPGPRELSRAVADSPVGGEHTLVVWREGREKKLDVRLSEMPQEVTTAEHGSASPAPELPGGVALSALGITLAPLDDAARSRFDLPASKAGAVVAAIDESGNAAEKGLQPGDVITRVNQDLVESPSDVVSAVDRAKSSHRKSVLLLIDRGGTQQFVAVELAHA